MSTEQTIDKDSSNSSPTISYMPTQFLCLLAIFLLIQEITFYLTGLKLSNITISKIMSDSYNINIFEFKNIIYICAILISVINITPFRNKLSPLLKFKLHLNIMSSPIIVSVLYFVIFSIGIYFSIISSSINDWFIKDSLITYHNSLSYVISTLFIMIILFVINQIATARLKQNEDNEKKIEYSKKIEQLQSVIRLAPPNNFASLLSEYVDISDDFVQITQRDNRNKDLQLALNFLERELKIPKNEIFNGLSSFNNLLNDTHIIEKNEIINSHIKILQEQIKTNATYIRALLIAYARLAALFDGITPSKRRNNIYRANLMLKYSHKDKVLPPYEEFRYIPSVLNTFGVLHIEHYLTLHNEHSVQVYSDKTGLNTKDPAGTLKPKDFPQDIDIKTFSMPVFLKQNQTAYNCIGAPKAVASAECQFINDTIETITTWKTEQSPPSELLEEAIKNFTARDIAKSIISIPLMHSRYDVSHKKPEHVLGVINIYRDKTNIMLGNSTKQQQFEDITTPLNYALAKIVTHDILHRYHTNILLEILKLATIDEQETLKSQEHEGT
ncbi:hypothetical protein [Photobacterium phosphoreum]|nr:hypothetical protein [Photobacterium phosphoreum]